MCTRGGDSRLRRGGGHCSGCLRRPNGSIQAGARPGPRGRPAGGDDLLRRRARADYTSAERRYGEMLQAAVEALLTGKSQQLRLLRRDTRAPGGVAVWAAPRSADLAGLRPAVVAQLLLAVLRFLGTSAEGGPVAQSVNASEVVETQQFLTMHAQIIVERRDGFSPLTGEPRWTEWRLQRLRDRPAHTQARRWRDGAELLLAFMKAFSGGRPWNV